MEHRPREIVEHALPFGHSLLEILALGLHCPYFLYRGELVLYGIHVPYPAQEIPVFSLVYLSPQPVDANCLVRHPHLVEQQLRGIRLQLAAVVGLEVACYEGYFLTHNVVFVNYTSLQKLDKNMLRFSSNFSLLK